jgi:hypothetical protein
MVAVTGTRCDPSWSADFVVLYDSLISLDFSQLSPIAGRKVTDGTQNILAGVPQHLWAIIER